jgi:copper chaperone NosL
MAHLAEHVAKPDASGVRHLRVVPVSKPAARSRRWLTVALATLGVLAFTLASTLPWWKFTLYAPQYPHGLRLQIALTGLSGDVHEIDMLNHYIGMQHLTAAAPIERAYAGYGVAGVCLAVLTGILLLGRRTGRLALLPAALFPIGFVVDSFGWLYAFGHQLDPRAPLHVPPFTPELFGNGQIGQFLTYAEPALGFWLSVAGVALVAAAVEFRQRAVCAHCAHAATCGNTCPVGFLGKQKQPEQSA